MLQTTSAKLEATQRPVDVSSVDAGGVPLPGMDCVVNKVLVEQLVWYAPVSLSVRHLPGAASVDSREYCVDGEHCALYVGLGGGGSGDGGGGGIGFGGGLGGGGALDSGKQYFVER